MGDGRIAAMLALALAAAGCGESGGVKTFGAVSKRDYATSADWRMIYSRTRNDNAITCAEPSPDIAKIAAQTGNFGLDASAKGGKIEPTVALTLAVARSESMAQLGKRLATIQLLRDALYRACEAYANQAISEATYAMIVSRYDDVMITLLLGELASGEGRNTTLATLSSTAALSGLSAEEMAPIRAELQKQLDAARDAEKAASEKVAATAADTDERKAAEAALTAARSDVAAKERLFGAFVSRSLGLSTAATAAMVPVAAGGAQSDADRQSVATTLSTMQMAYLNDPNLDAIMVGCLSALSQLDEPPPRDMKAREVVGRAAPESAAATQAPPGIVPPAAEQLSTQTALATQSLGTLPPPHFSVNLQDECRQSLQGGQLIQGVAKSLLLDRLIGQLKPQAGGALPTIAELKALLGQQ